MLPFPTVIVPSIVEAAAPVTNVPTLSLPKAIVPTFIFPAVPSRTTPVFLEPIEVILFAVSPLVVPLIYTPIPSVPVIVILLFCTEVSIPL